MFAGAIGWFAMGVLAAEVLNHFHLLEDRISAGLVACPLLAVFLVSEFLRNHFEQKALYSADNEKRYRLFMTVYDLSKLLLVVCLLLMIPLLWWGAIKKLAVLANAGKLVH
jgi:hypothetical protein